MLKLTSLIPVLLLISLSNAKGQEPKAGDYFPRPNNEKFVGVWKSKDPHQDLKITMINTKKIMIRFTDVFSDYLEGDITYIKDGVKIFDNKKVLMGNASDPNNIHLTFSTPNEREGIIEGVKSGANTIILSSRPLPRPAGADMREFKLPASITLYRVVNP